MICELLRQLVLERLVQQLVLLLRKLERMLRVGAAMVTSELR